MKIKDKVVVITGGASGIGAAMARRFAAEGASAVVVVDRDANAAAKVAGEFGGHAETVDVSDESAMAALIARTIDRHGRIDLFCSNAGIGTGVGLDDPSGLWQRAFEINVMAHVYAARYVVPPMLDNGGGYLLNTASAAGLLTSPGDGPYSVTKHGAVAFAEWLAVEYGGRGIGVSVLCPLGVSTPLLMEPLAAGNPSAMAVKASGKIISADEVAEAVVAGVAQGTFLILPHPEVATYWAQKASDPQRWISGVRRLVNRGKD